MKQLTNLLLALGIIILLAMGLNWKKHRDMNSATRQGVPTRAKVIDDLKLDDVAKIIITDDDHKVLTIQLAGDKKGVAERDGYPVSIDTLNTFFQDMLDLKIQDKYVASSDSVLKELGVMAPGGKEDAKANETGISVSLRKADDSELTTFVIGNEVKTSGAKQSSPFGNSASQRMLQNAKDKNTVWVVNSSFEAKPEAKAWLDKQFIQVQNLKKATVKAVKAEDSWSVENKDDAGFALVDAKKEEAFDATKVSALNGVLGSGFDDVLLKVEAGNADLWKDATEVVLETKDGFTYQVKLAPKAEAPKKPDAKPEDQEPPSKQYVLKVSVTGKLAEKRTPEKDEKPEDAKRLDDEFTSQKKILEEKLANEQKVGDWVYVVNEYSINALTKKRSELMKDKAAAPPAGENPLIPNLDGLENAPSPGAKPMDKPAEPAKPADKPVEPAKPADKPAEPTDKPADKPAEPAKPADKPAEPAKPADKPAEPAKPADKPAEPTDKPADKPAEPAKPADKPAEPAKPADKPAEPAKPEDKPAEPTDKPADKPAEPTDKPADKPAEPAKPADKPAEPAKPADKPAEPAKPEDKPAEPTDKPADKPAEPTDKPAEPDPQ